MTRSLPRNPTLVAGFDSLAAHTHPALDVSIPSRPRSTEPAGPLCEGQQLGDYRLEHLLGRGSSATVWRATDVRLQMPIALKLFTPRGQAGQAVLQGVMREARAASQVVSDHVIRVKDAGHFDSHGLGFIAMELCAAFSDAADGGLVVGKALEQELPRTTREAIRLLAEAACGVADAHREGIFHRDIKPANVLVRPGSRRAQITDFGLTVAELGQGGGGSVRIPVADSKQRRVILGTPDYMAPEAAEGLPVRLDPTGDRLLLTGLDVYGLGATLYAMIAGHPPYRPGAGVLDPIADILEQVRAGSPPSLMSLDHTRLPVTAQISRVVDKAMATRPELRYTSARAMAADLRAILEQRPTTLDAAYGRLRTRLFVARNRLQVSAALSVTLMLAALVSTALIGWQAREDISAAELRIRQLDAHQQRAQIEAARWESATVDARAQAELAQVEVVETAHDRDSARRQAGLLLKQRNAARSEADGQRERATAAELASAAAFAEATSWEETATLIATEKSETLAALTLERNAHAAERAARAAAEQRVASLQVDLDGAAATIAETGAALRVERAERAAAQAQAADLVGRVKRTESALAREQRQHESTREQLLAAEERLRQVESALQVHAPPPSP